MFQALLNNFFPPSACIFLDYDKEWPPLIYFIFYTLKHNFLKQ